MGGELFETIVGRHHGEIFRYRGRGSVAGDLPAGLSGLHCAAGGRHGSGLALRIATNLARNHSRNEKRRRVAHEAIGVQRDSDGDGPEGAARFNEARAAMDRVIDGGLRGLPSEEVS